MASLHFSSGHRQEITTSNRLYIYKKIRGQFFLVVGPFLQAKCLSHHITIVVIISHNVGDFCDLASLAIVFVVWFGVQYDRFSVQVIMYFVPVCLQLQVLRTVEALVTRFIGMIVAVT